MSCIYIDTNLKHPFIDNLKKLIPFSEIEIIEGDISEIRGLLFTSSLHEITASNDSAVVLCYETDDDPDFSHYIEDIWWDFLKPSYLVSVLNMTEAYSFLGDFFNIKHRLKNAPTLEGSYSSTLSIANAYTYCTSANGSILYSVITSASYREKVYRFFEKTFLGISENSAYRVRLTDEYTYYMKNLPYLNPTEDSFDLREVLAKLVSLVESFSKHSRKSVGDESVSLEVLDDHFLRYFKYIDDTESYSKKDLLGLKTFYESNRQEILSLQSFSQNNCNLDRCVSSEDSILFDYFSIYSVKEHYSSYLMDLGQLLISIYQYYGCRLTVSALQDIIFYSSLLPSKYLKFIYFFALLEGESIENKTIYKSIMSMFNREL